MLTIQTIFVLAISEVKLTIKLLRTKVYLLLACALCVGFYVLVELQYAFKASESASVGLMAPTYLATTLGPYFVALFCVAIVLLAYDLRERDLRTRINEVLETVPASNVIVVLGRLLGLVLLLAVPIVLFVIAIVAYGWIAESADLGYGNLIELHSVVSFLGWDLVPNLAFFGSLVIFLSTLIRSRLTVVLLALACIVVVFWLFLRLPLDLTGSLVTTTGATLFPSEIAPRVLSTEIFLNRLSLLLFTAGFVTLAGYCWSRPLSNRARIGLAGISFCTLSVLIVVGSLIHQQLSHHEVQRWVRAHEALDPSTFPDVIQISGSVNIAPGRKIELDLTVELLPTEDNTHDFVVLSLNPGYTISSLWVGGDEVEDYHFDQGILQVPIKDHDIHTLLVRILARGRPDPRFAYLDAAVNTRDIAGANVRNLFAMGTESYVFHPRFVVLTSGIKWYPTSGAATGEDELEIRPRDLYRVDLTVTVPKDWLVAGPGHRERIPENDTRKSIFQIAPKNPVPEMTLVGSNFERASIVVEDIEFEVLYTKQHSRRFEAFSEFEESLNLRILSMLYWYKDYGLVYPYELFSLVEVPTTLRVYGGGWKMDTIMGPTGMVLMRESSLPNSNVSISGEVWWANLMNRPGSEYSIEQKLQSWNQGTDLSSYFNSNVFGEHPTIGFARNFVRNQVSTTGLGATTLEHVMEEAVQRILFDRSVFGKDRIETKAGRAFIFEVALANAKRSTFDLFDVKQSKPTSSREELVLQRDGMQSEVWNDLERYSLGELSFDQAPFRSSRVLRLKSTALSRIMLQLLGRRSTATLFGELAETRKGMSFSYDDLVTVANGIDVDIEDALGDWLNTKGLPGFIAAEPSLKRLPDSEYGKVFEANIIVHNAEPHDGFATVSRLHKGWYGGTRERTRSESRAFLVRGTESVRLTVRSIWEPQQIDVVYLEPYLSLNREPIRIDIPDLLDEEEIVDEAQQPYVVHVHWSPQETREIIVDDLDQTFEIVYDSPPRATLPVISFARDLIGASIVEEWDLGLPVYLSERGEPPPKQRWLRRSDPRAYGNYRHTFTFVYQGKVDRPSYAKFSASLPVLGRWRLEYFMPVEDLGQNTRERSILLGQQLPADWYERFSPDETEIVVKIGDTANTMKFDATTADFGWNTLGEFDVDSVSTEVWISAASDKKTIYADAVRWVPLMEN